MNKKLRTCLLYVVLLLGEVASAIELQNPLVFGNNRLTLVTPTLFRLEYATDGIFLNDSTLFAVNRDSLLQDFQVKELPDNKYEITTSSIRIIYQNDGFPFGLYNFRAYYLLNGKETKFTNRCKMMDAQNLGGAISTLDRVKHEIPLDDGLLTRKGWYVIDDAGKDIIKNGWLKARSKNHVQDQYCFVYGNDYKAALSSLGAISGHVPMTRKYMHGIWYCRYWDYSDDDYRDIVKEYKQHNFPLDILVFDMGWHTYDAKVGTGHANNRSWTGYTWNKNLIKDPATLLRELKDDQIRVTLNDHPHDGIRPHEVMYPDFMRAMGEDPQTQKCILFDAGDPRYMKNFLQYAHKESMDMGVAFWWLDWQQDYLYNWVRGTKTTHLAWLNKLYFDESKERGLRGANYSRWAGWGDHRHPLNFSGDAYGNWDMLAFEVKLTATSGNAACYFWGHDIGGFYEGKNSELYTRWTQFGALSAMLRIHSYQDPTLDRRPWLWGKEAEDAMRKSYHLRAQLIPYIYTSVYQTHKTMVPLNRAMYIDYPTDSAAFNNPQQFMFGDLLLAAPITQPCQDGKGTAFQKVWFPKDAVWYDFFDGTLYKGGQTKQIVKSLDEFPLFVKGGHLLPLQPYSQRPTSAVLDTIILQCYPALQDYRSSSSLYEDDGETNAYEQGEYANTYFHYSEKNGNVTISLDPTIGSYKGISEHCKIYVHLNSFGGISNLKLDNKKVTFQETDKGRVVEVPKSSRRRSSVLTFSYKR